MAEDYVSRESFPWWAKAAIALFWMAAIGALIEVAIRRGAI